MFSTRNGSFTQDWLHCRIGFALAEISLFYFKVATCSGPEVTDHASYINVTSKGYGGHGGHGQVTASSR